MQPTLELARGVSDRAVAILERLPNLSIKPNQLASRLVLDGSSWPIVIVATGRQPDEATISLVSSLNEDDLLGMVIADRLSDRVRRILERTGHAYADATGAVHIDRPGILLHVEPRSTREASLAPRPSGVGVVGVRVVQTLLGYPELEWSVAALAAAASSSLGEAHRMLIVLDSHNLVTVTGLGPARRRRVTNPGALLDWLATVPSARRIRERVQTFLYSSNPNSLLSRLATRAGDAGISYAVTGTAGAILLGAGVISAIPQVMVRVDSDVNLRQTADSLGVETIDSGANLLLVRDLGRLGVHGSTHVDSVAIAPAVRVWLDMLGETRGEDAAALFRATTLGW